MTSLRCVKSRNEKLQTNLCLTQLFFIGFPTYKWASDDEKCVLDSHQIVRVCLNSQDMKKITSQLPELGRGEEDHCGFRCESRLLQELQTSKSSVAPVVFTADGRACIQCCGTKAVVLNLTDEGDEIGYDNLSCG